MLSSVCCNYITTVCTVFNGFFPAKMFIYVRMVVAVGNFVFHNLFISLEELHCDNWPIFVCTIAVGINMNLN